MRWSRLGFVAGVAFVVSLAIACDADLEASSTPTFKADIVPLLAKNCALSGCHASKESPQSFYITYDPKQMYSVLMTESPTCKGWKFISPGKPEQSMVMVKMDGEQDSLPTDCASARRSEMPPGDPPRSDSALLLLKRRDVLRAWIKAGAKND